MSNRNIYSFGELLTRLRKQRRISQNNLATKLDVHRNTIGKWERGIVLPESKTIVLELAKQLRLDERETRHLLEASLTAVSPSWNVPYQRNLFFTGRGSLLEHLHMMLKSEPSSAALTQSYSLHGLGGIGKTQLAIEYAYQHRSTYDTILWVEAETQTTLVSSFLALAALLALPEKTEGDQHKIVAAVLRWLNRHEGWLLVFDNVEDLSLIKPFLPASNQGALLLTTRLQSLGTLAQRVELPPMTMQEGRDFLLARTHRFRQNEVNTPIGPQELAVAQQIVAEMGGLPLALEQAGAYIEETGCSFGNYLQLYHHQHKVLLARRGAQSTNYPATVATTWSLSFQKVEQANPAAAELLRLCAFLEPDAIPEELISKGSTQLGPILSLVARDPLQFDEAIQELRKFSLIQRNPEARLLRLHRLVQVILKQNMGVEEQSRWAERVVRATNAVFPETIEMTTWSLCQRYLSQAQICTMFIENYAFAFVEAAALLYRTASYLQDYALYEQAEPLFRQAVHIQELTRGRDHLAVATSLNGLAVFYRMQGKYEQAEPLFLRALYIREQALGLEHPDVAYTLTRLAILYRLQGKYEQAEPLFLQAVHIQEQALGLHHPDVATSLNGLALLYWKRGKYEQAEPLFLQAKHIWEQALGPDHLYIAGVLQNLALLYCEQGKYEQAKSLYEQALYIWEQALGPDHPDVARVINSFGELYYKQGEYEQAEPLFLRALYIWEQALEPDCLEVTYALYGLAELYREQGRYTEAEPLFERVLSIQEHAFEPNHPDIADTMHGFAALQEALGKNKQAASFYSRALKIREQVYGQQHPKTTDTRERLRVVSEFL